MKKDIFVIGKPQETSLPTLKKLASMLRTGLAVEVGFEVGISRREEISEELSDCNSIKTLAVLLERLNPLVDDLHCEATQTVKVDGKAKDCYVILRDHGANT